MTTNQLRKFHTFLPIVEKEARILSYKYRKKNVEYGDLFSEGALMLHKTVLNDNEHGNFEAYVRIRVRGAMKDSIRARYWNSITKKTERHFFIPWLVRLDDYTEDYLYNITGIDLGFDNIRLAGERDLLHKYLYELKTTAKLILNLYFYRSMQLKTIGKFLGISEARVCQVKNEALLLLKNKLTTNLKTEPMTPA